MYKKLIWKHLLRESIKQFLKLKCIQEFNFILLLVSKELYVWGPFCYAIRKGISSPSTIDKIHVPNTRDKLSNAFY